MRGKVEHIKERRNNRFGSFLRKWKVRGFKGPVKELYLKGRNKKSFI